MLYSVARRVVILLTFFLTLISTAHAQRRQPTPTAPVPTGPAPQPITPSFGSSRSGPKPYKDVITSKAVTTKGLLTVHKVEDKWYMEIGDTVLGRDILIVNRLSKAGAGMRNN